MTLTLASKKAEFLPYTRDLLKTTFSQDMASLPEVLYRSNAPATIVPTVGPAELLTNGNLEAWDSITAPTNWAKSIAGTSSVNRDADAKSGSYCCRLDVDASNSLAQISKASGTCVLNTWNQLSLWAKQAVSAATLGTNEGFPAITLTAGYVHYLSIVRPSGTTFTLKRGTAPNASIYIDDVSLMVVSMPTCLGDVRTLLQSDYIAQVGLNVVAGTQIGLIFALDDATNPQNFGLCYHDGTNVHLVQCVAGVYGADLINTAATYVAGAMLKVEKTGATVTVTYNGAAVGTPQTLNAALVGNLKVGLFSTYSGNWFTQPFLIQKPNSIPCDVGGPLVATDTYNVTELLANGGFETVTSAGPPANFGTWTDVVDDGSLEVETTLVHTPGGNACKLTAGANSGTKTSQNITVIPGLTYSLSFCAAGDGTNAGRYNVNDVTNSGTIITAVSTGVTAATYSNIQVQFTAPAGCVSATIMLRCPLALGGIAYFDDVSVKPISSLLSVSDGKLVCKGGKSTPDPNWSDPRIVGSSFARIPGRMFLFERTTTATLGSVAIALATNFAPTAAFMASSARYSASDASFRRTATGSNIQASVASQLASTNYKAALLCLSTGSMLIDVLNRTLLWVDRTGTESPLWAAILGYSAAFTADNLRVRDLPGFSDYGWCLSRVVVPAAITPTLSGIELVTNGTFPSNINSWVDLSGVGSSISWNATEKMNIVGVVTSGKAEQTINTVVGNWYAETIVNDSILGIGVGTTQGAVNVFTLAYGAGTPRPRWRALSATSSLSFYRTNATVVVDDISVQAINLPSTLGTPQVIATTNFLAEVSPTIVAGTQAGLMCCIDNPANPASFVLAYHDGTNFHAVKCVSGTYAAESINIAATYAAGKAIKVIKDGTSFWFYYNDVLMAGSPVTISDAEIINNKTHTWWGTYSGNSYVNFELYPRNPDQLGGL